MSHGMLVCHPVSWSQHSLCPEPSLPTAGARWAPFGVVNCGSFPWIQHSWAGEHSSAWDSQLLKGDSSIISALITPSLSLASFCSADSTGRPEVFAVSQQQQLVSPLSQQERFSGTTILGPALILGTRALVRHTKAKEPFRQPGLLPQALQEDAEQPEEDESLFQRVW